MESDQLDSGRNERLARARLLLARPRRRDRAWPAVAAAGFFAASAIGFALVVMTAPTRGFTEVPQTPDPGAGGATPKAAAPLR